jgi:predicted O-methyltransferase YrrM
MNLSDLYRDIDQYAESLSSPEDKVLQEMRRYAWLKTVHPRMISGPLQGRFLEFISRMIQPENILEIGTFTGYSAICLAKGLRPGGKLITLEINDELRQPTLEFFRKAGLEKSIELQNGDALKILPELPCVFDLVFIDGEKEDYPEYYQLAMKKVKAGGYILADNVLWEGKVLDPDANADPATKAICRFNELVRNDSGCENVLLPIRDGLMLIRKI